MLPHEGFNGTQDLPDPYSGYPARLVVNLANKITTAIFPPGQKFFRFSIPGHILREAGETEIDSDTEKQLSLAEDDIQSEANRVFWRKPTYMSMLHLIVTGNVMEQMLPDNTIRAFRLDQYVVVRSPSGALTEFVVEEMFSEANLPSELRTMIGVGSSDGSTPVPSGVGQGPTGTTTYGLYTHGTLQSDGTWNIHQEFEGVTVPGSAGNYKVNPFNALRWHALLGEDYGRGKCDDHYADLHAINMLEKALLDGAAMASRNVITVRPNAATGHSNLRKKIAQARNGSVVVAEEGDVNMLQFDNVQGMQFTDARATRMSQDLAAAFLLNSGQTRDAERVTAFELRKLAEELEGALGGVYSMLSEELQIWRLRRLMLQMQSQDKLPEFPEGVVEPTILTGLEALGREAEFQRVATAGDFLRVIPPDVAQDYVRWSNMLGKAFVGLGIADAVNSEEEAQQIRERRAFVEAEAAARVAQQNAGTQPEPSAG